MNPKDSNVLFMIGTLLYQNKRFSEALNFFQTAINFSPDNEEYHNALGITFLSLDQTDKAKECFNKAISLNPSFVKTLLNMGRMYKKNDELDKAETYYRKVIEIDPLSIPANNNLGNILQNKGNQEDAIKCYENILNVNPNQAEAYLNLSNIFMLQEKYNDADEGYKRALSINPNLATAYSNLGKLELRKNNLISALNYLKQAFKLEPPTAESLTLLGQVYQGLGNHEAAIIQFKKALSINPGQKETPYLLGISLNSRGDLNQAKKYFKLELEIDPDSTMTHLSMGRVSVDSKDYEKAKEYYNKAIELDPDLPNPKYELIRIRLDQCDWSNRNQDRETFIDLIKKQTSNKDDRNSIPALNMNYFPIPPELHLRVAKHNARNLIDKTRELKEKLNFTFSERKNEKIKIGYVSPDFRQHAVGLLIYDIFRHHDRNKFEIYTYSLATPKEKDRIGKLIEKGSDYFVDISKVPFDKSAQKIYNDGIDILIDMAGFTTYSQTEIFALQPAPIQAQWLGFPGSIGADFMQYLIADSTLMPPELTDYFTEKIVHIPSNFIYSHVDISEREMTKEEFGIPEDSFVFACFNSLYKLSPQLFDSWMKILDSVPNSILWLTKGTDVAEENLINEIESRGIKKERIIFADKLPHDEYMARFKLVDLFLDTFYYSAGSTGVSAVAAGTPMLTLAGESNASRMGASIITSAGLPQLVTNNIDEYEKAAISLATDKTELRKFNEKLKLNHNIAPLFCVNDFVSSLEKAFANMMELYRQDKEPESFGIEDNYHPLDNENG